MRGADGSDVAAILEPHTRQLSEVLGAEIGEAEDGFFFLFREADTSDRSRWDELGDWLHTRIERYASALVELG